jgi:hypothetical protein
MDHQLIPVVYFNFKWLGTHTHTHTCQLCGSPWETRRKRSSTHDSAYNLCYAAIFHQLMVKWLTCSLRMREVRGSNPAQVTFDFIELKVIIGNKWSLLSELEPEYSCMASERSNHWTTNWHQIVTSITSGSAHTHIPAERLTARDETQAIIDSWFCI